MKTRLLLIRHAQSEWNASGRWQGHADPPLDATGRDQARRLAHYLQRRHEAPAALYASPLRRALGTAEIVGAAFGLQPVVDEQLKEYDVGVFQGLTLDEVQARYPSVWRDVQANVNWVPIPQAEDRGAFCDRAVAAFDAVLARHGGQTVMVVTHGGVLGAYLTCLLGLGRERHAPFAFGNASLTILEQAARGPRLVLLNDTCHLHRSDPEPPEDANRMV